MTNGLAAWICRIPDDVSLSDISIPGTHDSATYRAAASDFVLPLNIVYAAARRGAKFVQCQSLTLRQQLDAGVRFLDLRIMPGERFPLYHGPAPLLIDLAFALDEIDVFLAANDTETVIVSIKQESEDDRKQTSIDLKAFLQKRSNRPFIEGRIPVVREVRGMPLTASTSNLRTPKDGAAVTPVSPASQIARRSEVRSTLRIPYLSIFDIAVSKSV